MITFAYLLLYPYFYPYPSLILEEQRAVNLKHLKEEEQRREEKQMVDLMSLIDKVGKVNSTIRQTTLRNHITNQ